MKLPSELVRAVSKDVSKVDGCSNVFGVVRAEEGRLCSTSNLGPRKNFIVGTNSCSSVVDGSWCGVDVVKVDSVGTSSAIEAEVGRNGVVEEVSATIEGGVVTLKYLIVGIIAASSFSSARSSSSSVPFVGRGANSGMERLPGSGAVTSTLVEISGVVVAVLN